jgi:ketosteroid isomerase-like protein
MSGATKVVNEYLAAFYSGDLDAARAVVAEGYVFKGPFVEASDREAFFQSAARLVAIARGHRLLKQVEQGEEVCSLYEVNIVTAAGSAPVTMSEWHAVRDGRLASGRAVVDTAAFRALVPAR